MNVSALLLLTWLLVAFMSLLEGDRQRSSLLECWALNTEQHKGFERVNGDERRVIAGITHPITCPDYKADPALGCAQKGNYPSCPFVYRAEASTSYYPE